MLTAKVIDGHLDVPDGTLEEGITVTILVPEGSELGIPGNRRGTSLRSTLSNARRGEGVEGWDLHRTFGTALGHGLSIVPNAEQQIRTSADWWWQNRRSAYDLFNDQLQHLGLRILRAA